MVQRNFFNIQVKNDAKHQQPEFSKTNLLIFNMFPRQLDVKTQKRPTLIMSKSFENADLLSFLAKCIQAPLQGADRSVAETLDPGSRSHPHKKKTQRVFFMRITGLEPARDSPLEPKSSASANSAISASKHNYSKPTTIVSMLFTQSPKIV